MPAELQVQPAGPPTAPTGGSAQAPVGERPSDRERLPRTPGNDCRRGDRGRDRPLVTSTQKAAGPLAIAEGDARGLGF